MRKKLFLALYVASLSMCLIGCDSSTENQVGTGEGKMPEDVRQRQDEMNKKYQEMMDQKAKNPTPSDGRTAPPGG